MTVRSHMLVVICVGAFLSVGCSREAASPAVPSSSASAPNPAAAAVKPEVSINAVMVALIDHAGHELWNAEHEGKAPKTSDDWERIEEHAVQLAAAGPAVSLGGTGPSDAVWVRSGDWQKYAQALSDAGTSAASAAKRKDLTALVAANSKLVESCESCHKQFKPDLPTEGITHSHSHENPSE